jgi:hypothetical protein
MSKLIARCPDDMQSFMGALPIQKEKTIRSSYQTGAGSNLHTGILQLHDSMRAM